MLFDLGSGLFGSGLSLGTGRGRASCRALAHPHPLTLTLTLALTLCNPPLAHHRTHRAGDIRTRPSHAPPPRTGSGVQCR